MGYWYRLLQLPHKKWMPISGTQSFVPRKQLRPFSETSIRKPVKLYDKNSHEFAIVVPDKWRPGILKAQKKEGFMTWTIDQRRQRGFSMVHFG